MNNEQIINKIRTEQKGFKSIRATTIKQPCKDYLTVVMKRYSGGEGVGVMGAVTIYEVKFKTILGANKLTELINQENKKER